MHHIVHLVVEISFTSLQWTPNFSQHHLLFTDFDLFPADFVVANSPTYGTAVGSVPSYANVSQINSAQRENESHFCD